MPAERDTGACAVFVANRAFMLRRSCLPFLRLLIDGGWRVVAVTYPDSHAPPLEQAGVRIDPLPAPRKGFHPRADLDILRAVRRARRRYRPRLLHSFSAKPVILGNLALSDDRSCCVVNTLTGLGHPFIVGGWSYHLARAAFALTLRRAQLVTFLNRDDLELFGDLGLLRDGQGLLFRGEGVDPSLYPREEREAGAGPYRVIMVGRILWQKGIREYVEAARILKERKIDVRLAIAGEIDAEHPDAVPRAWLERQVEADLIDYLGYVDLPTVLARHDCFCLPSYREGQPRVILEAAACGLPTIAADVPGCRDNVQHGRTGILVPARQPVALAQAIAELAVDPSRSRSLGRAAREMVLAEFDIESLAWQQLAIYRGLGLPVPTPPGGET